VAFKKKITRERNSALRARFKELTQQESKLQQQKADRDKRRESQLRFLRSTDTFEKFKDLQKNSATGATGLFRRTATVA
jgi:uncharacterized protein YydD (DUF2326 family)